MGSRYVKCQMCKESILWKERFELCEIEQKETRTGKARNLYYHKGECWEKHLEQEEFIKKEMKEKDELNEVMKKVHGVRYNLPQRHWEMIQDLRNGTNRYEKFWKKRYKEGVPYNVIKEAYLMSKQDIEWAKLNKRFKNLSQELFYCLKIVLGKINDADRKIQRSKQAKSFAEANEKNVINYMYDEREVEYKNNDTGVDMSDILGDD